MMSAEEQREIDRLKAVNEGLRRQIKPDIVFSGLDNNLYCVDFESRTVYVSLDWGKNWRTLEEEKKK